MSKRAIANKGMGSCRIGREKWVRTGTAFVDNVDMAAGVATVNGSGENRWRRAISRNGVVGTKSSIAHMIRRNKVL